MCGISVSHLVVWSALSHSSWWPRAKISQTAWQTIHSILVMVQHLLHVGESWAIIDAIHHLTTWSLVLWKMEEYVVTMGLAFSTYQHNLEILGHWLSKHCQNVRIGHRGAVSHQVQPEPWSDVDKREEENDLPITTSHLLQTPHSFLARYGTMIPCKLGQWLELWSWRSWGWDSHCSKERAAMNGYTCEVSSLLPGPWPAIGWAERWESWGGRRGGEVVGAG